VSEAPGELECPPQAYLYCNFVADDEYTIRECVSLDDFQKCVDLERRVWKNEDIDVMPVRLYQISKACNAPTLGAFTRSDRLVAFGHTTIALREGGPAYHSHMLAVEAGLRDQNLGYKIKLAQRQHALREGIGLIFWTFDPLISRNAHFNINKLGVVLRRYERNYYGQGVSTGFEPDIPTDRVIAEWWVASDHVKSVLAGHHPKPDKVTAEIEIPDDINSIRAHSAMEHLEWRMRVREQFETQIAGGAVASGFLRDPESRTSRYLLTSAADTVLSSPGGAFST
jgi:predicted GNAT superfamily acetyltransferase